MCKTISVISIFITLAVCLPVFSMDQYGLHAGRATISGKHHSQAGIILGVSGLKKQPIKEFANLNVLYLVTLTNTNSYRVLSLDIEGQYHLMKSWYLFPGLSINRASLKNVNTENRFGYTLGTGLMLNDKFGLDVMQTWVKDYDSFKIQLSLYFDHKYEEQAD